MDRNDDIGQEVVPMDRQKVPHRPQPLPEGDSPLSAGSGLVVPERCTPPPGHRKQPLPAAGLVARE